MVDSNLPPTDLITIGNIGVNKIYQGETQIGKVYMGSNSIYGSSDEYDWIQPYWDDNHYDRYTGPSHSISNIRESYSWIGNFNVYIRIGDDMQMSFNYSTEGFTLPQVVPHGSYQFGPASCLGWYYPEDTKVQKVVITARADTWETHICRAILYGVPSTHISYDSNEFRFTDIQESICKELAIYEKTNDEIKQNIPVVEEFIVPPELQGYFRAYMLFIDTGITDDGNSCSATKGSLYVGGVRIQAKQRNPIIWKPLEQTDYLQTNKDGTDWGRLLTSSSNSNATTETPYNLFDGIKSGSANTNCWCTKDNTESSFIFTLGNICRFSNIKVYQRYDSFKTYYGEKVKIEGLTNDDQWVLLSDFVDIPKTDWSMVEIPVDDTHIIRQLKFTQIGFGLGEIELEGLQINQGANFK